MISIPITQTADEFAPPTRTTPPVGAEYDFQGTGYSYGSFLVYTASVFLSIKRGSSQGQASWGPEFAVGPSVWTIGAGGSTVARPYGSELIFGIRARSYVPGTPATIFGSFFQPGEVSLSATATTANSLGPGGVVNPCPCGMAGGSMETTNDLGSPDVNPTTELLIGAGLVLTEPVAGTARVDVPQSFGFWQVNVWTIAAGTDGKVPDNQWSSAFGPPPQGITLSGGVWTFTVPGVYLISSGCRFATTNISTMGGILNFSLINATIADHQVSMPIGSLYASNLFEQNPGNSMLFDTGQALGNNTVDHLFHNGSDVDMDVGFVNVSFARVGDAVNP